MSSRYVTEVQTTPHARAKFLGVDEGGEIGTVRAEIEIVCLVDWINRKQFLARVEALAEEIEASTKPADPVT